MKSKILALLLLCTVMLGALSVSAAATDEEAVNATIDRVYGGNNGIVTLTFDDGKYDSALVVDELLEKYNLKATLMMIAGNVGSTARWNELFETGRLVPQSHSTSHIGFRNNEEKDTENLNEAAYKKEILDSKTTLEALFPNYDVITYAIPYGTWCDEASAVAMTEYYMARCSYGGVQSLDPGFELNNIGDWSALRCVSINTGTNPAQLDTLKAQVDEAANGAWLCTITHTVGNVANSEFLYDHADELFSYISYYEKTGRLWVTDTASATKYIRERQNATLNAKRVDGKIVLSATLAETTADGLPLDESVFNHPLTVKVEVGAGVDEIHYLNGCVRRSSLVFSEGERRYARVELVPNGEEIVLETEPHDPQSLPHDFANATCTEPKTCKVCYTTVGEKLGHTASEVFCGYTKCVRCDEQVPGTGEHDYADATCTEPKICKNCEAEDGDSLGHDYADATCTAPKTCIRCEKTMGSVKRHDYANATCTEPKTCKDCGDTTGDPLGHKTSKKTCANVKCTRCRETVPGPLPHDFAEASCTAPKTCKVCDATEGEALSHKWMTSDADSAEICEFCGAVNDEPTEDEPTEDEPTEDEPTEDEPTEDEPTEDEPTEDEPTEDEPTEDEPTEDEPTEDEPTEDEPTEDEPTEDVPTEDVPTEDEPTEDEPTTPDEPENPTDSPSLDDPIEDETATDKPTSGDNNQGLGTGAIIGIAAGSAAALGCGGFALVWFVIKKKSFADLFLIFKK